MACFVVDQVQGVVEDGALSKRGAGGEVVGVESAVNEEGVAVVGVVVEVGRRRAGDATAEDVAEFVFVVAADGGKGWAFCRCGRR